MEVPSQTNQPGAVEDDKQYPNIVKDSAPDGRDEAHSGQDHENHDAGKSHHQVLTDDPA